MLPIAITSWYGGKKAGIFLSVISAITWFWADIAAGHIYSSELILVWNTVMRLCLFVIVSIFLSIFKIQINQLHKDELKLQKDNTIIETLQKLTVMIVSNITVQNAEIIKWVNESREKNGNVPQTVEKSSQVIGESLHILSEVSFVSPYTSDSLADAEKYIDSLEQRLSQVKNGLSSDDK